MFIWFMDSCSVLISYIVTFPIKLGSFPLKFIGKYLIFRIISGSVYFVFM